MKVEILLQVKRGRGVRKRICMYLDRGEIKAETFFYKSNFISLLVRREVLHYSQVWHRGQGTAMKVLKYVLPIFLGASFTMGLALSKGLLLSLLKV